MRCRRFACLARLGARSSRGCSSLRGLDLLGLAPRFRGAPLLGFSDGRFVLRRRPSLRALQSFREPRSWLCLRFASLRGVCADSRSPALRQSLSVSDSPWMRTVDHRIAAASDVSTSSSGGDIAPRQSMRQGVSLHVIWRGCDSRRLRLSPQEVHIRFVRVDIPRRARTHRTHSRSATSGGDRRRIGSPSSAFCRNSRS